MTLEAQNKKLRQALEKIAKHPRAENAVYPDMGLNVCVDIARQALSEESKECDSLPPGHWCKKHTQRAEYCQESKCEHKNVVWDLSRNGKCEDCGETDFAKDTPQKPGGIRQLSQEEFDKTKETSQLARINRRKLEAVLKHIEDIGDVDFLSCKKLLDCLE